MVGETFQPQQVCDEDMIQGPEDGPEERTLVGGELLRRQFRRRSEDIAIHPAIVFRHELEIPMFAH
jgi:hypothetical protein